MVAPLANPAEGGRLAVIVPVQKYPVCGTAENEMASSIQGIPSVTTVTVIVFPEPEVVAPFPPMTFKMFAAGVAIPESVTNDVGTVGGKDPATVPWKN